jgi:hypothetical protein
LAATTLRGNATRTGGNGGAVYSVGGGASRIAGGSLVTNTASGLGGAICVTGTAAAGDNLTVDGTRITGNRAGRGAGIYVAPAAKLALTRLTLDANQAGQRGGGLYNAGKATLQLVVVSGNRTASGDGGTGGGGAGGTGAGGIDNFGQLSLQDVTLADNRGQPGGVFNAGTGSLALTGVTVSANRSAGAGGGIDNRGDATLVNVTLSDNQSAGMGAGLFNTGSANLVFVTFGGNFGPSGIVGALFHAPASPGQQLTLKNTLLAAAPSDNTCGPGSAALLSAGFNLASDNSCLASLRLVTDRNLSDPQLRPLGSHAGPTRTRLPGLAGAAIDHGQCDASVFTDQRGIPRPQGKGCDIGAVEMIVEHRIWLPRAAR